MYYLEEHKILVFLVQLFLLLGAARGLGELFRKIKQPPLTAEVLVGILFGPTIFGRCLPELYGKVFPQDVIQRNMLETVAWIGVLFFLIEIGLEFDFSSAWRQRANALKIAVADIAVPLVIAFAAAFFLPVRYMVEPSHRLVFSCFMAMVMTISCMPVTARMLHDLKLSKTDLGFLIVAALTVNDIIGWLLFTLVLGLFTQATPDMARFTGIIAATIAFTFLCLTIGKKLANFAISKMKINQVSHPANSLTFICLLALLCGAVTQKIGIHPLFGFFIAGIMAGGAKALSERTRQVISQMVYAVFVPVFFANIGLKVDFLKHFDIFIVLFVTVISVFGKFLGAWIGATLTDSPRSNRPLIAIAHTPGGMMEIVVGLIALQYNLIAETVFVGIVCGALFSSVILGPWFAFALSRRREVSIFEFFSNAAVVSDIKAEDRDKAIEELCKVASANEDVPEPGELAEAVISRENVMGTAMEEGIAVPHARLSKIKKPVVVFGRSKAGIYWNSPDGRLSRFVFLILTPKEEDDAQVQILGSIAVAMSTQEARSAVMEAEDSSDIWNIFRGLFTACRVVKR